MQAEVKSRPMLFSAPMVRALRNGTKTQTRRLMKPQPYNDAKGLLWWIWSKYAGSARNEPVGEPSEEWLNHCPHGKVGDLIWGRETHWINTAEDIVAYRADGEEFPVHMKGEKWKPGIHMFLRHSRILLEITDVRVQRLQDISEEDAIAEGIERIFSEKSILRHPELKGSNDSWKNYLWHGHAERGEITKKKSRNWYYQFSGYGSPIGSYSSLWESINGSGSWDANPWVWCISFKVVKGQA